MNDIYDVYFIHYQGDTVVDKTYKGEVAIPENSKNLRRKIIDLYGNPPSGWVIDYSWKRSEPK